MAAAAFNQTSLEKRENWQKTMMENCHTVKEANIQGGPPKSIHFCWATALPVSTLARRSVSQIKRTLQDFQTRGWVTRSDNFGAR